MREQIEGLKNHADGTPQQGQLLGGRRNRLVDDEITDDDAPAGRGPEHVDAAKKSALAGTAWADDGDHLSRFESEVHIVENDMLAVFLADRLKPQDGLLGLSDRLPSRKLKGVWVEVHH